jgi:biopolymer transport protein ExbB
MATVFDFLAKGGPVMVPIVGASVLTISCALERMRFWSDLLRREGKIVNDVLAAAPRDLNEAAAIANQHHDTPIGRFLYAPLRLRNASPETFRLAMETAADREFVKMRQGEKLLETIVAISPLLGLLGTVTGLIATFYSLDIGGSGGGEGASKAAAGIGEALITTAAGMVVAILALLVLRVLVSLQSQQADYFSEAGNELELIYRQHWYEPALLASENGHTPEETPISATYQ